MNSNQPNLLPSRSNSWWRRLFWLALLIYSGYWEWQAWTASLDAYTLGAYLGTLWLAAHSCALLLFLIMLIGALFYDLAELLDSDFIRWLVARGLWMIKWFVLFLLIGAPVLFALAERLTIPEANGQAFAILLAGWTFALFVVFGPIVLARMAIGISRRPILARLFDIGLAFWGIILISTVWLLHLTLPAYLLVFYGVVAYLLLRSGFIGFFFSVSFFSVLCPEPPDNQALVYNLNRFAPHPAQQIALRDYLVRVYPPSQGRIVIVVILLSIFSFFIGGVLDDVRQFFVTRFLESLFPK